MDLFDLVAKITLDSSEYEKSLDSAEKKGSDFGTKIKGALANGAKVTAAAVAALGTGTIALGKAFVSATGDLAAYGDEIDKESQKMGISAEAYQEWDAILQHCGGTVSDIKMGLVTLSKQVDNDSDAFQKLGLSTEELKKMSKEEVFAAVIEKLQGMEEGVERTALANELLGRSSKELGALLNTSAEETQAMKERVHELGGVMSDEAVKAAATYQDKLQDMKTAMGGLKNTMITDFLPGVSDVMGGLTEIFSGNSDKGIGMISSGIDSIITKLSQKAPKIMETGAKIVQSIGKAIVTNLPKIAESGGEIILELIGGLIESLPDIAEAAVEIITTFIDQISAAIPDLIPAAVLAITTIVQGLIDNLPMLVEAGITLITSLVQGLIDALPIMIEQLPVIVESIVTAITDSLPLILDAAVQLIMALTNGLLDNLPALIEAAIDIVFTLVDALTDPDMLIQLIGASLKLIVALAEGLIEAVPKLVEKVPEIIGKLVSSIIDNATKMWEAAGELIAQLWEGITQVWDDIKTWGGQILDKIWEGLQTCWDNVKEWGKETISNIWTGITECWDDVKQWASGIFSHVSEGFDEVWSDVADIGASIVEWIWNGLSAAGSWLYEQLTGWVDDVLGWLGDLLGISSPSKKFAELGDYSAQGYANGLEEGLGKKKDEVKGAWLDLKNALSDPTGQIKKDGKTNGESYGDGMASGMGSDSMYDKVYKAAAKIARAANKAVQNVLQIASPSKVAMGLGKFFGEGMELGIEAMIPDVEKASEDMAKAMTDTIDAPELSYTAKIETDSGEQNNSVLSQLLAALADLKDNIQITVMLDDGTLLTRIDTGLGTIAQRKARGN